MSSFSYCATISFLVLTACAGAPPDAASPAAPPAAQAPATFTFAPVLDKPYHHTQRRFEEVSMPGSPMRNSEEWIMDWDVVTKKETNLFRTTQRLVGLKININGLSLLKGDEVKDDLVAIDILNDKDANLVDVRGTDQLSEALVGLAGPEAKDAIARIFSPQQLKALAIARSIERHADFVGRPTEVGSQWMANSPGGAGPTKQIRVVREEPCGPSKCLRVIREYEVDREAIYANVSAQVAAYVKSQGGDDSQVKVVGMDIKHEDSLLIDPHTMEYHGAQFIQDATLKVATPNGELQVAFKFQRDSTYKY